MPWYTTDHARRDAARQAAKQQPRLLDTPQTSKQVTGYECAHCRAAYGPADERCPRCGAFEARKARR